MPMRQGSDAGKRPKVVGYLVDLLAGGVTMSDSEQARRGGIGVFEFAVTPGELRCSGRLIAMTGQPLRVLTRLVERAEDVVTREELRKEIRTALGDRAAFNPAVSVSRGCVPGSGQEIRPRPGMTRDRPRPGEEARWRRPSCGRSMLEARLQSQMTCPQFAPLEGEFLDLTPTLPTPTLPIDDVGRRGGRFWMRSTPAAARLPGQWSSRLRSPR